MRKLVLKDLALVSGIALALFVAGCNSSGRDNGQDGEDSANAVFTPAPSDGADDGNTAGPEDLPVSCDDLPAPDNDPTGALAAAAITACCASVGVGDVCSSDASNSAGTRSAMINALDAGTAGLVTKDATKAAIAAITDPLLGASSVGYLSDAVNTAFDTATAEGTVSPENLQAALANLGNALAELGSAEGTDPSAAELSMTLAVVVNGLAGGLEGDSDAVTEALDALAKALDGLVHSTQLSPLDQIILASLRASL